MGRINFPDLQDLSEEERGKRFSAMRKRGEEISRRTEEKVAKVLDAKQNARLAQLRLQREGAAVFQRDDVVARLKLTDVQKEKIRDIVESSSGGFPPPGPAEQKRSQQEVVALLSDSQKNEWSELTGPAFEFPDGFGNMFRFGPGGPGGPGGSGGERKLVEKFDKDGDGRLNAEERKAARESMAAGGGRGGPRGRGPGGPGGGPGGPGGPGGREPGKPGAKVSPNQVKAVDSDIPLYDPHTLRTLFLTFDGSDWEKEMADFKGSDVEMPASLMVDGKTYPNVGVHFRGASSFGMVPDGSKRSLNVSLDFVDEDQRLLGYKTLNLLNSNGDPSFLHSVLFSHIARQFIPAPKVNLVKVVINGENWGVYVNAQQFDKTFLKENFPSAKGTRWKVPGRPGGRGGLEYIGDNVDDYKRTFEMKTDDGDKAWKALISLCKTLKETPAEELEKALDPILDIEGVLWFLALDCALVNEDGYWTRASDYSLFQDDKGKFHVIPHDMNETFHAGGGPMRGGGFFFGGPGGGPGGLPGGFGAGPGGSAAERRPEPRGPNGRRPEGQRGQRPEGRREPGGREERGPRGPQQAGRGGPGGPGGGFGGGPGGRGPAGTQLDPLVGLTDSSKPLRNKLLAVPSLRTRYLQHVHTIADTWLDWKTLGPIVADYEALISSEVEQDTRKLSSFAAFKAAVSGAEPTARNAGPGGRPGPGLRAFASERRKFLLEHPAVKEAAAQVKKETSAR